ncbi:MAG: RNA polymerase sigma factor [Chthoniobacteraceae bacterium]
MDTSDHEDQQLIARIASGDEVALKALIGRYSHYLYQFASSILGDHDRTQQAVSNVFISIWQRRLTLSITHSVNAYLFSCTNYQAFRLLRKQAHLDEVSIDDVPSNDLVENSCVVKEVQLHEFIGDIEALLEKMPPERQKVFRMSIFENTGYKEIASALGISVSGVQKHMLRAKAQMAAALPKLGYPFKQDPGL